ncbi:MAG: histidine utilization repressor [Candidatus Devosia phytovorans]|uniref:Histidine utilization repressor n=1 Tax=Candidatus Devosia phytovorans TaxID=3121372 RepID=A0AAJ6B2M5_9HYPH|nr:histidine utilization repressor [Devosia sp.]WEK06699.1 MAG: histidine utilization repressor [Devosia sp.]
MGESGQAGNQDPKEPTLHQRIQGDIENKIVSGEWPVGFRIPFEIDLAKQYGVSRMTVNKVLTQLARAGLIDRIKRSGSFVSQPHTQSAVLEIGDIRSEVESLKLAYDFRVIERIKHRASPADRLRLEVPASASVMDVTCLHRAGGKPFCLEERLISLDTVPEAEDALFTEITPGQWLLRQVPWSSAEHRIHASAADAATAASLGVEVGTACLVIERRTWSNSGPVTQVKLTYPGDRHALTATFAPSS